jgi:hypothetical protein
MWLYLLKRRPRQKVSSHNLNFLPGGTASGGRLARTGAPDADAATSRRERGGARRRLR